VENVIKISPVTRIEGNANIFIKLDEAGNPIVANVSIPELRGFEKFMEGMDVIQAPHVTQRVCGVCPVAHFMASSKAVDMVYGITPSETSLQLRRLMYNAHYVHSHGLHFFLLASPDFLLGDAGPSERNVLGLLKKDPELATNALKLRSAGQKIVDTMTGKPIHPSFYGLGGVARPLKKDELETIQKEAKEALELVKPLIPMFGMVFDKVKAEMDFEQPTHHMGLINSEGTHEIYDGHIQVIKKDGTRLDIAPTKYYDEIGEKTLPYSNMKAPILKNMEDGVYRVGPLSRLNICKEMKTPLAQEAFTQLKKDSSLLQNVLLNNYARLIELIESIERCNEIAADEGTILKSDVRQSKEGIANKTGIGVVEAPRGTLIHHFDVDDRGFITGANLIVATQNNVLTMNESILTYAKNYIKGGSYDEKILNGAEMILRSYDPCFSCSTHAIKVHIVDDEEKVRKILLHKKVF